MTGALVPSASSVNDEPAIHSASGRWCLDDIDFNAVPRGCSVQDEALLLLLIASSFVEAGTRLYAGNLSTHFDGNESVTSWLRACWEPEELQHGLALRTYIARVWPDFDWDRAHVTFMRDYVPLCTLSKLEHKRGLEMAARCVVETGTTALYRAINLHAREPVLRALVRQISDDELGHYKRFLRYFRHYQQAERNSRIEIFCALLRRSLEIKQQDTDLGLRHACVERYRGDGALTRFAKIRKQIRNLLRNTTPLSLAAAMWLRPLDLGPRFDRNARRILSFAAHALILG